MAEGLALCNRRVELFKKKAFPSLENPRWPSVLQVVGAMIAIRPLRASIHAYFKLIVSAFYSAFDVSSPSTLPLFLYRPTSV
jgi:hypothetical protein